MWYICQLKAKWYFCTSYFDLCSEKEFELSRKTEQFFDPTALSVKIHQHTNIEQHGASELPVFHGKVMTVSRYFIKAQRIKNFCWAEKLGKINLGWLCQPSAQENSREANKTLCLIQGWNSCGFQQAPGPGGSQPRGGGSGRMQASLPALLRAQAAQVCTALLCFTTVRPWACSHRNKNAASACCLPGAYMPVFPVRPESHQ